MSIRWRPVIGGAVLALALGFWLFPRPIVHSVPPEIAQARQLRTGVQDWQRAHASALCPDLTSLEVQREFGPDVKVIDSWGSPYLVRCEPDETVVFSFGPDRLAGTLDDLTVPRPRAAPPDPGR